MREQYDGRALPYTAAMGLPELRQAIADFYRERHDLDIDPKRICVTAGGSAALLLATALTVDPGDDVIVADPSYPCNRELVRSFEGRVIDVPTSAATRFHLTADLCSCLLYTSSCRRCNTTWWNSAHPHRFQMCIRDRCKCSAYKKRIRLSCRHPRRRVSG